MPCFPPSIKHSGSVACADQGSSLGPPGPRRLLGWGPALGCLLLHIPAGAPVAEARATKAEGEGGECRGGGLCPAWAWRSDRAAACPQRGQVGWNRALATAGHLSLGSLNNRHLFPSFSLGSGRVGFQGGLCFRLVDLCLLLVAFPQCAGSRERARAHSDVSSSSCKGTVHIRFGPYP